MSDFEKFKKELPSKDLSFLDQLKKIETKSMIMFLRFGISLRRKDYHNIKCDVLVKSTISI